jgi:phosphinothricin acetyltransferase
MRVTIAPLEERHWAQAAAIYAEGIATGHSTFETEPPTWVDFTAGHLTAHSHVALDEHGDVLGWVAASHVSSRCVYAGVVEESVYVAARARGMGVGRSLLQVLIDSTEAAGIWTIQAGIFPENLASLRLHADVGFEPVGVHRRLGLMTYGPLAGTWRDVVLIERRSDVTGR